MAFLCFLFYLNYCIYFHILDLKLKSMEINCATPVSARVSVGYRVCQPPLVYLCICFVFLYVCRFFIAFDFAFFSVFCNKEKPKPCLKYFTISNDKCTPRHLPERAPNTKDLEWDSSISGDLAW